MSMYLGNIQVNPVILEDNFIRNSDGDIWERPSDWPDLDSLELSSNFEGLYLTYENTSATALHCAKFSISMSPSVSYNIAIGYVNNNNFVSLSNQNYTSGTVLINFSSINRDYIVILILPNGDNHFTSWSFTSINTSESGTNYSCNSYNLLCLDRRGNLPYLTSINNSWCTRYMQKDRTNFASQTKLTSLSSIYSYGANLNIIDMSEWNTSNWAITSLSSMFSGCYNLKALDFDAWDTSNWAVTSLHNMFSSCYNLQVLDLNNWDTSNWAVTNLSSMFYSCYSLNMLNINNWDTSNWKVTSLTSMFSSCYSLKVLNINNWNTSNWKVTALNSMFSNCYSLKVLNINNWDTSNWAITTLSNVWYNCTNLKKILAFNWNLDCTKVTSVLDMCSYCLSLEEIDLSNWNFSNSLTDVRRIGGSCASLKKFNISSINTAGITNYGTSSTYFIGNSNYSLKELVIPPNWKGGLYFSSCHALPRNLIINAFNNLADNTGGAEIKIYISNEIRSRLTDADLAIVTNKGYTLST